MALEVIDVRRFETRDFAAILRAEARVWSTDFRWDYTASTELITAYLEEKRLAGFALVNQKRIEGYSLFFYDGEKGVIGNLFVESDGDRPDRARLLLMHVIETLMETPRLQRIEAQLAHFALEDLDSCFRERGFQTYLRRFMALDLRNRAPGSAPARKSESSAARAGRLKSDEFLIEPWERKYDRAAAELLYYTYRQHVDAAINDQYLSPEGARRLIENIVQNRGCGEPLPKASLVAVHRPSRKLAGILCVTMVRERTAHIPQIAVAKEFQGTGLGTAMMESAFDVLAQRGFEEISLTVTDLNRGAVRLYERLGFETFRTFGAFAWNGPETLPA